MDGWIQASSVRLGVGPGCASNLIWCNLALKACFADPFRLNRIFMGQLDRILLQPAKRNRYLKNRDVDNPNKAQGCEVYPAPHPGLLILLFGDQKKGRDSLGSKGWDVSRVHMNGLMDGRIDGVSGGIMDSYGLAQNIYPPPRQHNTTWTRALTPRSNPFCVHQWCVSVPTNLPSRHSSPIMQKSRPVGQFRAARPIDSHVISAPVPNPTAGAVCCVLRW